MRFDSNVYTQNLLHAGKKHTSRNKIIKLLSGRIENDTFTCITVLGLEYSTYLVQRMIHSLIVSIIRDFVCSFVKEIIMSKFYEVLWRLSSTFDVAVLLTNNLTISESSLTCSHAASGLNTLYPLAFLVPDYFSLSEIYQVSFNLCIQGSLAPWLFLPIRSGRACSSSVSMYSGSKVRTN